MTASSERCAADTPRPAAGVEVPRPVALVLLVFGTLALTVLPHLVSDRFYLHDDLQDQYIPLFHHIGAAVLSGRWPTITLETWLGGHILLDPQFGLANPVSLASYAFLSQVDDLAAGMLVLACLYALLVALGGYLLARIHGASHALAAVAGVAIGTLPMVSYWYANAWFPGLVGTAWCTLAWATIARYAQSRGGLAAVVLATWLTLATGWPHATLILAIIGAVEIACLVSRRRLRRAAHLAAAMSAAAMLAAPGLVPPLLMLSATTRDLMTATRWFVSDLGAVLQVSLPSFRAYTEYWWGYRVLDVPMYHAAWFVVPLLPFLDWRRAREVIVAHPATGIVAIVALFLPLGPGTLGPMRWPMRFLPVFQTAVLVLWIALLAAGGLVVSRRRLMVALLLVLVQLGHAAQVTPERVVHHAMWSAALVAGMLAVVATHRRPSATALALLALTGVVGVAMHVQQPHNPAVPDWGLPRRVSAMGSIPRTSPRGYTVYLGKIEGDIVQPDRTGEYRIGNQFLLAGAPAINGYSSLGHGALQTKLCMDAYGGTCPDAAASLFAVQRRTGRRWVDLMGIDRIIVHHGAHQDAYHRQATDGFAVVRQGRYTSWAERLHARPGAGTVSYVPDDVTVERDEATPTSEHVRLRRRGPPGPADMVVFARLFWPGYEATLDGRPIPVRALGGILPTVDLPAESGEAMDLVLRYRTPGLRASFAIAALGVLLAAITIVWSRRDGRAAPS